MTPHLSTSFKQSLGFEALPPPLLDGGSCVPTCSHTDLAVRGSKKRQAVGSGEPASVSASKSSLLSPVLGSGVFRSTS